MHLLTTLLALGSLQLAAQTANSSAEPARKRGVSANKLSAEDMRALQPGVSWFYNWHYESADERRGGLEFMPMIWTADAARIAGAKRYLDTKPKPRMLMALNEPNLSGQANMDPQKSAEAWKEISRIARAKGVPLTGPHMAISAPNNELVHGYDPIQKKNRNLSYMIDFLDAFFHYADPATVDGIGIHAYGNIWELKWAVDELHKKYNKPIWVTEFAEWGARDADAEIEYMIQAVDFLERSPHVAGYAWFKERFSEGPNKMSLLERQSGKLTRLGELYVNMPVHDPAIYHRIPGRVEAEADIRMQGVGLTPTQDTDGWFHVHQIDAGDWMEYQIEVATAGNYTLAVRVASTRAIGLRATLAGNTLARIEAEGAPRWQTATAQVRLPAGRHTLRLEATTPGFLVNWFELTPLLR